MFQKEVSFANYTTDFQFYLYIILKLPIKATLFDLALGLIACSHRSSQLVSCKPIVLGNKENECCEDEGQSVLVFCSFN